MSDERVVAEAVCWRHVVHRVEGGGSEGCRLAVAEGVAGFVGALNRGDFST